jgi:transcriptional regulator with XRE-family HTH domain
METGAEKPGEETMERDVRLDWEGIVREARRRRKQRRLTQEHLAALAKVGRSTLVRFENEKADLTLSSALRILGVLDMLDRKVEGDLLLRREGQGTAGFVAMFAPNFGGGSLESKAFTNQKTLGAFLESLGVSAESRKHALMDLERTGSAAISRVQLSHAELLDLWPIQFTRDPGP